MSAKNHPTTEVYFFFDMRACSWTTLPCTMNLSSVVFISHPHVTHEEVGLETLICSRLQS